MVGTDVEPMCIVLLRDAYSARKEDGNVSCEARIHRKTAE